MGFFPSNFVCRGFPLVSSKISHPIPGFSVPSCASAPGVAPSPPPSPEEDDFFAWAKQAVAWAVPMDQAAEEAAQEAPDGVQEEEERGLGKCGKLRELGPEKKGEKHGKTPYQSIFLWEHNGTGFCWMEINDYVNSFPNINVLQSCRWPEGLPRLFHPNLDSRLIWLWINTYENTIFRGLFTSINPSYFDVHYRGTMGFDTLPYQVRWIWRNIQTSFQETRQLSDAPKNWRLSSSHRSSTTLHLYNLSKKCSPTDKNLVVSFISF